MVIILLSVEDVIFLSLIFPSILSYALITIIAQVVYRAKLRVFVFDLEVFAANAITILAYVAHL